MPFDPHDFLMLARQLLAEPGEAELRTAISRSYYAVHLYAREKLAGTNEYRPTGTGRDHGGVIVALRNRGGSVGDMVDSLRRLRIMADYRVESQLNLGQAERAVHLAEWVWPGI